MTGIRTCTVMMQTDGQTSHYAVLRGLCKASAFSPAARQKSSPQHLVFRS